MEIDISNLTKDNLNLSFFKKIVKDILEKEKIDCRRASVVFVESKEIRKINKKYRKKDKATDVLSFNYSDSKNYFNDLNLGEVFICPSQIKKENKDINRVLIHGILHLLGYDHEKTKKEERIMDEKEEKYLSFFI